MNALSRRLLPALLLSVAAPAFAQTTGDTPGGSGVPSPETSPIAVDPADAVDPAEVERAIVLLSAYHGLPDRASFEQQLSDPARVMFHIARDAGQSRWHRDRAIAALALWPSDEVRSFYEGLLAAPDTSEMNRHRLIGFMAQAFGDDAIPSIEPFLTDGDVQFRLTAVEAMRSIDTEVARAVLSEATSLEQSPVVLERVRLALMPRP